MTNLQVLLQQAVATVQNEVGSEEKFIVRDLFKGIEWNRLSRGERIKLGSLFLIYAESNPDLLKKDKKTAQNQQIYIKL